MMMNESEIKRIAELVASQTAGGLNRQQLCAALGVSESTVRRLEQNGLPYTPVGKRSKRYDLVECKTWLKENQQCPSGTIKMAGSTSVSWSTAREFTESCRKVQLRVMPSE
jgi:methylphosphotriester-DNA--protein-cysteine methyltransferase